MGSAMAERLADQKVPIVVYNRTRDRAAELAAKIGAAVASTPADAARQADVVISMVADDEAVAEGLVLAEQNGIEPALAYDVLAASAGGAPYVGYKRDAFLDAGKTPVAFSLALAAKDLTLIQQLATAAGVSMPQAGVNLDVI